MRVTGRSKRTPLLVAAVALLVAANAWWFWPRGDAQNTAAFQLADSSDYGRGSVAAGITRADIDAAPFYDAAADRWLVQGKPIADLHGHMLPAEPRGKRPGFVIAGLAQQATTEDVRKALLNLTGQGICLVALPDAVDPQGVSVHRIVAVRDDRGELRHCKG
ncbi:hypothetical protein QUC32_18770 [Novosphingobium resinovorum]|uniref:hypothetical protein n=1 Tax=Novosphingobium TaxID=165696 RepID=UPI001B3C7B2C|nr:MULTISPECIES: hypothetical protein [Novosphingobium]WJM26460.1 hypothetical protein QUC32_18770 [Novosphingobium resinovorum]